MMFYLHKKHLFLKMLIDEVFFVDFVDDEAPVLAHRHTMEERHLVKKTQDVLR